MMTPVLVIYNLASGYPFPCILFSFNGRGSPGNNVDVSLRHVVFRKPACKGPLFMVAKAETDNARI